MSLPAPCPVCGGSAGAAVWRGRGRGGITAVLRCAACGVAFCDPMPAAERLGAWYSAAYFARLYGGDREGAVARHAAWLAEAEARLGKAGRALLDVGCGVGDLCVAAARRGWIAIGIEAAPAAAAAARGRGVETIETEAAEALAGGGAGRLAGRFDLIVFRDVLGHLRAPGAAVQGAVDRLHPGGWVAVRMPNRHAGIFRLARWAGRVMDASPILHLPAQIVHADRAALAWLLRAAGLDRIAILPDSEGVENNGGRYSRRRLADLAYRRCVARWARQGEPEALWGWGRKP